MRHLFCFILLLCIYPFGTVNGAESSISEQEAPLLSESRFADAVKRGNCIVMYYTSDERTERAWGMTPVQLGDYWLRGMLAFRERLGATIRFYRVNWKGFSPESMGRIRSDLTTTAAYPPNPTFAVYTKFDARPARVRTAGRPDMYAWFIHDVMDDFMPIVMQDKWDFLFTGWLVTDSQSEHINVVNERKGKIDFNGMPENVQIVNFTSQPREGFGCSYEKIYSSDGRLIGSIENYGPFGTFGYFDYDRTGTFRYRVRYPAVEGK